MADATGERWDDQMVQTIYKNYEDGCPPEVYKMLMAAAVEVKTVRFKIALARCYELLVLSVNSGEAANPDDGFTDSLLELLK